VNDALLACWRNWTWRGGRTVAAGIERADTARSLQLLRDGRVLYSFGLGADSLSWQGPDGQRQAAVPGAALQSALDRLTP